MDRQYQSLDGKWKINWLSFEEGMEKILDENFVPEGWLTANVPQQVQSVLRKEGIIKGHTYQKDPEEDLWTEECDWVYYREFTGPEFVGKQGEVLLECCGLDTFCDVYLNGILVGRGNNMFRKFSFPVRGVLKPKTRNVIAIRFYSAANYVRHMEEKGIFSITTSDRILARKAQMNYGWDFCGRTVTVGIWKSIGIRMNDCPFLEDWFLETRKIEENKARLSFLANVRFPQLCGAGEKWRVRAELLHPARESVVCCGEVKRQGETGKVEMEFEAEDPLLWWPRPYGEPHLYRLRMSLFLTDRDNRERVYETKEQNVGIRMIEVVRRQQEDGRSFQFCVNGRELFIRGANWVPMRMVYTDIEEKDYETYLDYAVKGRISMLRIWGGGIYEHPRMFELCDEKGILIWNDFMLACGIYPQNDGFLDNIRLEAEQVVKEYRNYACLAIWSGDNENGQAYGWAGRDYEFMQDRIGNEVLRKVCEELDPRRCYIPTSPCSPDPDYKGGDNPSSPFQGDQHIYIMSASPGVNAYRDYGNQYYKRILGFKPRFMSEFGFISLPEKETFYRYNFLRKPIRNREEMIKHLPMAGKYLERNDFDHAIYYSQLFQAMALKFWIEYFRSLKGICNGTLYWKFNDPVADCPDQYIFPSHMATVDMYQHPKMSYYYTKRAYADVLVEIVEENYGDLLKIYLVNETLESLYGKLVLSVRDFTGAVLWHWEGMCQAKADAATLLHTVSGKELAQGREKERYLKAEWDFGGIISENRYYFVDINENDRLELPAAGLKCVECFCAEKQIKIRLKSACFARNVRLTLCGIRAHYSDNYFDLDAGEEKTVCVEVPVQEEWKEIYSHVLSVEAENQERFVVLLEPQEEH